MTSGPDGPVFAAPWEARAFALAVALRDGGHLRWADFQERLAARLASGDQAGYHEHWLAALEDVVRAGALGPGPAREVSAGG